MRHDAYTRSGHVSPSREYAVPGLLEPAVPSLARLSGPWRAAVLRVPTSAHSMRSDVTAYRVDGTGDVPSRIRCWLVCANKRGWCLVRSESVQPY